MTPSRLSVSILCLSILWMSPALSDEPAVAGAADESAIKGNWKITSSKYDGKELKQLLGGEMRFDGKALVIKANEKTIRGSYKLDPSKKPKWIDIKIQDGEKTTKFAAIYALDGDTLKICHGESGDERPTELASKPGDRRSLAVLSRVKAK